MAMAACCVSSPWMTSRGCGTPMAGPPAGDFSGWWPACWANTSGNAASPRACGASEALDHQHPLSTRQDSAVAQGRPVVVGQWRRNDGPDAVCESLDSTPGTPCSDRVLGVGRCCCSSAGSGQEAEAREACELDEVTPCESGSGQVPGAGQRHSPPILLSRKDWGQPNLLRSSNCINAQPGLRRGCDHRGD